jgi:ferrochelatase
MIWTREGSPLKVHTQKQAICWPALQERGHEACRCAWRCATVRLRCPRCSTKLKAEHCDRIVVLPAYPQYSGTTTASISDAVFDHYKNVRNVPELRMVKHYHDHDGYIDALHDIVQAHWDAHGRGQKLVMSFHGVPKRTLMLGDPYYCECQKTARLLASRLRLAPDDYVVTFQSRFGKAEWLQPYTAPTVQAAGARRACSAWT